MKRGKYWVGKLGYDIQTDLHHGFIFGLTKAHKLSSFFLVSFHFNWPHLVWYNKYWAMDEAGYIQGMPVYRQKPKRWLLRGVRWPIDIQLKLGRKTWSLREWWR